MKNFVERSSVIQDPRSFSSNPKSSSVGGHLRKKLEYQLKLDRELSQQQYEYIQQTSPEKIFECELCHRPFLLQEALDQHYKLHTKSHKKKCLLCGYIFMFTQNLKKHLKMKNHDVTGKSDGTNKDDSEEKGENDSFPLPRPEIEELIPVLSIPESGRPVSSIGGEKSELNLIPIENTSVSCEVCGDSFKNLNVLTKHLALHDSTRSHVCKFCSKRFKREDTLRKHAQIHVRRDNLKDEIDKALKILEDQEDIPDNITFQSTDIDINSPGKDATKQDTFVEELIESKVNIITDDILPSTSADIEGSSSSLESNFSLGPKNEFASMESEVILDSAQEVDKICAIKTTINTPAEIPNDLTKDTQKPSTQSNKPQNKISTHSLLAAINSGYQTLMSENKSVADPDVTANASSSESKIIVRKVDEINKIIPYQSYKRKKFH